MLSEIWNTQEDEEFLEDSISDDSLRHLHLMKLATHNGKSHHDRITPFDPKDYKSLLNSMNAGLIVHDFDSAITHVNDKFCRMTGYNSDEILGVQITELINVENKSVWRDQSFNRHRSNQHTYELAWITKNGDQLYTIVAPQPLFNDEGINTGGFLICVDFTKRKWIETVLRKSEEKYRDFIENINDIIFGLDEKGVFTFISPVVESLLGYTRAQVINKPLLRFVYHDDIKKVEKEIESIFIGRNRTAEFRIYTKDCTIKSVRFSCRPIFEDNQVVGVNGVLSDISEKAKYEAALRINEKRYRDLVERSADAVFVINESRVVYLNRAGVDMLGAETRLDVIGSSYKSFICPSSLIEVETIFHDVLNLGKMSQQLEVNFITKTGGDLEVELVAVPFTYKGSQAVQVIVRNIVKRKRAEKERLKEKDDAVKSEKIDSLSTLAGGIAHDFNNILTAIIGNASLALMDIPASSPLFDLIRQIEKAADRASMLTKRMLEYSGRGRFVVTRTNLTDLIRDMESEIQEITTGNIDVIYNFEGDSSEVEIDRSQIRQALDCILTNSVEAVEGREGKIVIRTFSEYSATDMVSDFSTGKKLPLGLYSVFEVEDNGVGITADDIPKIFDPFFSTKFTGRGLGLAAVFGIVKGHGGFIKVESEEGTGTIIRTYLPTFSSEQKSPFQYPR